VLAKEDDTQYGGVKKLAGQIAKAHNATAAQVILRWLTQQHVGVIPRSRSLDHLSQNLDLWKFRLSDDEMRLMNAQQSAGAAHDEL
jgi:diketogulonate reductase-like aldo/keto reductase